MGDSPTLEPKFEPSLVWEIRWTKLSHLGIQYDTAIVDGRNLANHLKCKKPSQIMGQTIYQQVSRISAINSITLRGKRMRKSSKVYLDLFIPAVEHRYRPSAQIL